MAALLSEHSVLPRDFLEGSGRDNDLCERYGHDLSDDQLMCLVDKFWTTRSDRHVAFLIEREQSTIRMDLFNNRGDMGSGMGLPVSIESPRQLSELRVGPKRKSSASPQLPTGPQRVHGLRERHEEGESAGTIIGGCWSPTRQNLPQAPVGRRDLLEGVWQFGKRPDHAENDPGMLPRGAKDRQEVVAQEA